MGKHFLNRREDSSFVGILLVLFSYIFLIWYVGWIIITEANSESFLAYFPRA